MAGPPLPNRVPPGVPTGGQFAPKFTAELSGVDLIDDAELVDTWCEPARPDTSGLASLGAVDIELAVEAASRSGHFWAWRYGCDSDDLASETLLAWWGAMSRKVDNEKVVDVRRYISRTARNLATHAIAGATRAEDRRA